VGNVYYYFKTKDELVQAAIDAQAPGRCRSLGERGRAPGFTTDQVASRLIAPAI
jgi:AcrR family transcriptional regulator